MRSHFLRARAGKTSPGITLVGVTTNQRAGASTSITLTLPSGTQKGDLMIAFLIHPGSLGFSAETGWTDKISGSVALTVRTRIAGESEGNVTFDPLGTANTHLGFLAVYRYASFDVIGSTNTAPIDEITLSNNNSVLLAFAYQLNASITFTDPSGFTSIASNSDATNPSANLFEKTGVSSGATGSVDPTPSSGTTTGVLLGIKPAEYLTGAA